MQICNQVPTTTTLHILAIIDPFLTAVGAAILAAAVTFFIDYRTVQRDRVKRCMDLSEDFTSGDFMSIRIRALNLLDKFYNDTVKEPAKTRSNEYSDLAAVSAFYQHVGISFAANTVSNSLVISYFGRNFVWWYVNLFSIPKGPIECKWSASEALVALYKNIGARARSEDWKTWHLDAKATDQPFEKFKVEQARQPGAAVPQQPQPV